MARADQSSLILKVVSQAPAWIRTDLSSKDPALRERAEEALAAMVAAALDQDVGGEA
jgi:hypothetical protein